jgi:hypothetical protein
VRLSSHLPHPVGCSGFLSRLNQGIEYQTVSKSAISKTFLIEVR